MLLFAMPVFAQVYEAKNCVYREGDDPRWAQPDYDDSAWQRTPPDPHKTAPASPYLWERCRFEFLQCQMRNVGGNGSELSKDPALRM